MKIIYYYFLLAFIGPAIAVEYTVGVEDIDYYPFYSVNPKGEYIGFARDLLDSFAKNIEVKFIYEIRSIKKLNQEYFSERRFDFKFPDNKLWGIKRKKGFQIFYSLPVCNFIDGVIVQEENKKKDLSFFKTLGIGMVRGYTMLGYAGSAIPIKETPNVETLIEKLKYGQINGAYFNVDVALSKVNFNAGERSKFAFNQKLPYYKSSFYLSSFNHSKIIYKFNQFLIDHRDEVIVLKRKYGIKD